jgi:HSP20 family protein
MYIKFAQPVFGNDLGGLNRFGSMADDLFTPFASKTAFPAVDVVENEVSFELVAELPGLKKEDIKISIENRMLTLSGERKHYGFPEGTTIIRHETQTDPFRRSFGLPEEVEAGAISAEMNNGILRVRLPKIEKAKPRDITIK